MAEEHKDYCEERKYKNDRFTKADLPIEEMINIYILFIRSLVEYSCVVWHSSITEAGWDIYREGWKNLPTKDYKVTGNIDA